jgi:hypothetical protein
VNRSVSDERESPAPVASSSRDHGRVRTYYGPVRQAFAALDAPRQEALQRELVALLERYDRSGGRALMAPAEYLEAVITRR